MADSQAGAYAACEGKRLWAAGVSKADQRHGAYDVSIRSQTINKDRTEK